MTGSKELMDSVACSTCICHVIIALMNQGETNVHFSVSLMLVTSALPIHCYHLYKHVTSSID